MKKITFLALSFFLFITSNVISQAPANNDCSGAIELFPDPSSCNNSIVVANINGDTTGSGVPDPGCGGYSGGDIWYKLDMPSTGGVRIETSESDGTIQDGGMAVYTGTCGSLNFYACNDNGNPVDILMERLDVARPENQTIYIRLWTWNNSETGNFNICTVQIPAPPVATNDDCIDAEILTLDTTCSNIITGSNNATNSEIADPSIPLADCDNTYAGRDIWYKFTVPNTNHFAIETSSDDGSIEDTVMALYSGSCGSLTQIDCNDDIGGGNTFSRIEQTSTETELFVRVWSLDNLELGTFNICATELPALSTDKFDTQEFKLFPNPARDIVNLKFNKFTSKRVNVAIYDVQGKRILTSSKDVLNNLSKLDVSTLKTGIYFLEVNDGINSIVKKLAIN